jgi:Zn-dependent peptidase ImmA (M78 family)
VIPRLAEPPFDLDGLADWLGLMVEYRPLPASVPGFYAEIGGRSYVVIDSGARPERRRWTLAHEIAHHILSLGITRPSDGFALCDSRSDDRTCDRFAAQLLMPEAIVRRKVEEIGPRPDDKSALLAGIFGVSRQAMRIRLRELGLLFGKQSIRKARRGV